MTAPTEPVESALALVDAKQSDDEKAHDRAMYNIRPFVAGSEFTGEAAARILAAEVRRLRAELASQPMIATETRVLPKRR